MSYSTFEYGDLSLSSTELTPGGNIQVSVKVTNSGNYDGEEVVQLYVQDLVGSVTRPVKELKGYQKISLAAGETACELPGRPDRWETQEDRVKLQRHPPCLLHADLSD